MSSSGTPQETAPKSSGYRVSMFPTSRPPLDPPTQPSRAREVMPRFSEAKPRERPALAAVP
jgi:hypothetical protein